jgi:LPS-assembly protein
MCLGVLLLSTAQGKPMHVNSTTLPEKLSYAQYSQHIANELDWLPNHQANTLCPGNFQLAPYLQSHHNIDEKAPLDILANGPEVLRLNGESTLSGGVTVTQPGRMIKADKIILYRDAKTHKITHITLLGHVKLYQENSLVVSDTAVLNLAPRDVRLNQIAYHYYKNPSKTSTSQARFDAWGTATNAHQNTQQVITLNHGTYSYCPPISPAWRLDARKIILDKEHNIGKAYDGVLRIKNFPVFYWPYYSFQLNNERKSGFLMPEFGSLGKDSLGHNAGFYFSIPYYLNLAPNYDLVNDFQSFGTHGFRLLDKFRYISEKTSGDITASFLPDDQQFLDFKNSAIQTYSNTGIYPADTYGPYLNQLRSDGSARGEISSRHQFNFNEHWSSRWFINWVSDPYYIVDTASLKGGALSTTNELLSLGQFDYNSMHWQASLSAQTFQTLFLITQVQKNSQNLAQYTRAPDINLAGYYNLSERSDFVLETDYTDFLFNSAFTPPEPEGNRLHIRPGFIWDYEAAGGYIKPNVWLDSVGYALNDSIPNVPYTQQRTLPIFNLDTGLRLYHPFDTHTGNDLTSYQQTLEPRLFYLYIPYENQTNLPNFDTIFLPYYFDQLYSLNTFQGVDRLENANQVTLGLSSRTIRVMDAQTLFSFGLGAIYYMDAPKVCLTTDCVLKNRNVSPIVANLSFTPDRHWSLNNNFAWDPKIQQTNNSVTTFSYHGDGRRIVGLSYAFINASAGSISPFPAVSHQTDNAQNTSYAGSYFAWPLSLKWTALANTYYDIEQKRLLALYTGAEYDSCCWSMRLVYNRSFNDVQLSNTGNPNNQYNNSYFVQITLKGLGSIGTRPESFVQSIVPGYQSNYWEKP